MDKLIQAGAGQPELVVIFKADADVRAAGGSPVSSSADFSSVQAILNNNNAVIKPLFGLSEDRLRQQQASIQLAPGLDKEPDQSLLDLASYYMVHTSNELLQPLAEQLFADDNVVAAYVKPAGSLPILQDSAPLADDAPPVTPNFINGQGYLNPAPEGVDARFSWTLLGGDGAGVRVIDCEWGWRFTHEDLLVNQGGIVSGTGSTDTNHGTSVLGVISGDSNNFGITGISPSVVISSSSFNNQSSSVAIRNAANKLNPGDIILLEIHRPGPNAPTPLSGQLGYIAIEWWPDDFAAIRYAVGRGIIVVEAAGNGYENLDDPIYNLPGVGFPPGWKNPFNPANFSSGAVIVGAGAPPPGTHGANHGPDRSRLDFSNYGFRVDAQGWGQEVTTTGGGSLQGGMDEDMWYTDTFNGTSSASPVVVGALANLQGILITRGRRRITSPEAITLLRATGSPQQDALGRPASQRIGNRPNLRALVSAKKLAPVTAVARSKYNLDLFVVGNDGVVYTSWWYNGADWSGINNNWRPIGGYFPPGTQVSAVARSKDNLDLFVIGYNGVVYTSWWYNGADWSGINNNWRPIGGTFPVGATVSAVARSKDNLDLFVTGNDGIVYTSWWYNGADWSGINNNWRPIGGVFPAGAPVTAVTRLKDNLDLFITGNDGIVYTSWWYSGVDWSGIGNKWKPIGGIFPAGTLVSAVARTGNNLDLFAVAVDGVVYTSWWYAGATDWSGIGNKWKPIGGIFPVDAQISAVARTEHNLDLFAVARDGVVYTSWWYNGAADWSGIGNKWRPIGGIFPVDAQISAVARTGDNLDLFAVARDGVVYTSWWYNGADWSGIGNKWRSLGGYFPA